MINPTDLIRSYDEAIITVFGPNMARLWPHAKDLTIATRWLEAGATLEQCVFVFKKHLEQRKERNLTIPHCLSYFDNMVRDAVATRAFLETQSDLTLEESRWNMRLDAWRDRKFWQDIWGPSPAENGCMAPRSLLKGIVA